MTTIDATGDREVEVCARFRDAVAALEAARGLLGRGRGHYGESARRLRESATSLLAACVTARLDASHCARAEQLLSADLDAQPVTADTAWLRQDYERHRALVAAVRRELARQPGDRMSAVGAVGQARRFVAPRVAVLTAIVAGLLLIPSLAYFRIRPMSVFEAGGQLFWKSDGGQPFAEQRSLRFAVPVDNVEATHTLRMSPPVAIAMLRLDPVNHRGVTRVEINRIELVDDHGLVVADLGLYTAAEWPCTNCEIIRAGAGGYRLRPLNNDPYLVSPPWPPLHIGEVRITMRAAAHKTFWEWVLGLDAGS